MANFVSPGVYIVEKDMSDYPASINPSVVGVVGFADQGPTNKATLITSQEGLVQTFGNPVEDIPGQGLEGSLEMLETTNSLYFVRAAGTGSKDASASVQLGGCPAFGVSAANIGTTSSTGASSLYLELQVSIGGANLFNTPKSFNIPSGTVGAGGAAGPNNQQAVALKSIIGGSLDGANIGSYYDDTSQTSGYVAAGFAGSGVVLTASSWTDSAKGTPFKVLRPLDQSGDAGAAASSVSVTGISLAQTGTSSIAYSVQSLYTGRGYNEGAKADGTTSGYSTQVLRTGGENVNLQINRDGAASESFRISLLASGSFAEDVINTGSTSLTSQYIKGYFIYEDADASVTALTDFVDPLGSTFIAQHFSGTNDGSLIAVNPRFVKPIEGTYKLSGGINGTQDSGALIGSVTDKTGIYSLDDDTLNIGIGIVPGNNDQTVQNTLINLAESTQNFIAVVSPPEGLNNVQQAIDWSNGQSEERTAAISSNYTAIYWPWVQTYDTFSAKDRYYDPSIYAVRQMAYTDEVGDSWFAPAGTIRGRLTKPTNVEVSVNQGDRDSMYSGGNVVNPIVNFPQDGIMIFGQRTAQRTPTALDRVNVRRLMIYIRKVLLASTRRFVFEPNDSTTWEKITNVVNPLLDDILRRRGLVDFKVVCDETTNTPVRVDRNELWCKVLLKPTKTAEVIVFELNLTNQSAQI